MKNIILKSLIFIFLISCATKPTLVDILQYKNLYKSGKYLRIMPVEDKRKIDNKFKNDITINGIDRILSNAYISSGLFLEYSPKDQPDSNYLNLRMDLLDLNNRKFPSFYSFGPGILTAIGTSYLLKSILSSSYYIPLILGGAIIIWDLALGYEYTRVYSVKASFTLFRNDSVFFNDTLDYEYTDRFSAFDQYRVKKAYGYDYHTTTIDEKKLSIMQLSRCINNIIFVSADTTEKFFLPQIIENK